MKPIYLLSFLLLISCNNTANLTPQQIRIGIFKTTLNSGDYESIATRNDSIQIETYNHKKDTFYIHWLSNFEYTLLKKNPKNEIDKKKFIVKITGVNHNSYSFMAHFEGNNFKQKGRAIKFK